MHLRGGVEASLSFGVLSAVRGACVVAVDHFRAHDSKTSFNAADSNRTRKQPGGATSA
jgi:hypothetical protein